MWWVHERTDLRLEAAGAAARTLAYAGAHRRMERLSMSIMIAREMRGTVLRGGDAMDSTGIVRHHCVMP